MLINTWCTVAPLVSQLKRASSWFTSSTEGRIFFRSDHLLSVLLLESTRNETRISQEIIGNGALKVNCNLPEI